MIWFLRKKTPLSEIEAIANRKLMETLVNLSIARSQQSGQPFLEAAGLIRNRVIARQKRHPLKKWQHVVQQWLGLSDVMKTQHDDLLMVAERLKIIGDAAIRQDQRYHCATLMLSANELDQVAGQLAGDDKKDIEQAAHSVRTLAVRFSDNKEKKDDNDDSTANAST